MSQPTQPEKPMFTAEQRAYFRECAARRRRVDKACAACGAPLVGVVAKRRFCGNACAQRYYRQSKREAQP